LPVANTLVGVLWHPGQQTVWWTGTEARKLYRYHPQTGEGHWLSQPESQLSNNRFNEGKVDRRGRF
jgi:L-arabinonolactonase